VVRDHWIERDGTRPTGSSSILGVGKTEGCLCSLANRRRASIAIILLYGSGPACSGWRRKCATAENSACH